MVYVYIYGVYIYIVCMYIYIWYIVCMYIYILLYDINLFLHSPEVMPHHEG